MSLPMIFIRRLNTFPDFIFTLQESTEGSRRLLLVTMCLSVNQ